MKQMTRGSASHDHIKYTLGILLTLIVLLVFCSVPASGDDYVAFLRSENKGPMAFMENGDVLCLVSSSDGTSLERVNQQLETIWNTTINEAISPIRIVHECESGDFIIVGGGAYGTAKYDAILLDGQQGSYQAISFVDGVQPLLVTDEGCLILSFDGDQKTQSSLTHVGWNGEMHGQSKLIGQVIQSTLSDVNDEKVFFDMQFNNANGERITTIACFDIKQGLLWQHDLGKDLQEWITLALCTNHLGGVTVIAQHTVQNQVPCLALLEFDAGGYLARRLRIDSEYWYPSVDILEQDQFGNYQIWGSAGLLDGNGNVTVEDAAYHLVVNSQGNYMSDEMAATTGNCIKYKNGNVYTYQIDYDQYAVSPFIPLKSQQGPGFRITQE